MKKEELKKLTVTELKEKEKGTKVMIGIFVPIILALAYFNCRDYFAGEDFEMPSVIITICSIGGMVSLFPGLKMIRDELKERIYDSVCLLLLDKKVKR